MSRNSPTTFRIALRITGGFVLILTLAACAPRGKIADESQNAECAEDIEQALEAFRTNLGLAYYVDQDDVQDILGKGRLQKEYAGLGVRYAAHFGLKKTSEGCHLKFYKRTSRQPGETNSTTGNYGTVGLEYCQCK